MKLVELIEITTAVISVEKPHVVKQTSNTPEYYVSVGDEKCGPMNIHEAFKALVHGESNVFSFNQNSITISSDEYNALLALIKSKRSSY